MSSISTTKTCLFLLFLSTILLLNTANAQELGRKSSNNIATQGEFKKVYLDGILAYKHTGSDKIISLDVYNSLGIEPKVAPDIAIDISHWDHRRVNAYRNERTLTPFLIQFDQTTYAPPVSHGMVVTSRFGRRRRGPHKGIDIDLITGNKVMSILPGKVRFVGYSRGHGKTVVVRHANEVETVYAHLSKYNVKIDDVVTAGQVLGNGGATGNARGSHLHFEVRYRGICIHPEYLFNFDGTNTIRGSEIWVTSGWKNAYRHSSYKESDIKILTTQEEAIAHQIMEPKYHRVKKGDTLYNIARTYNIKLSDICSLNAIKPASVLRIGKTLQVQ